MSLSLFNFANDLAPVVLFTSYNVTKTPDIDFSPVSLEPFISCAFPLVALSFHTYPASSISCGSTFIVGISGMSGVVPYFFTPNFIFSVDVSTDASPFIKGCIGFGVIVVGPVRFTFTVDEYHVSGTSTGTPNNVERIAAVLAAIQVPEIPDLFVILLAFHFCFCTS